MGLLRPPKRVLSVCVHACQEPTLGGQNGQDRRGAMRIERLSPRERDILRLAAEGLTNAAIADRLGLARTTVMSYWTVIYSTLRLTSRPGRKAQAIAQWRVWQGQDSEGST